MSGMHYHRTNDPHCLELPLPDHGLHPEPWAYSVASELHRLCPQFLWRYHMHGAMPTVYGWNDSPGGLVLHATHGRDREDREVLRIYPMTMCQEHAYEVAALLFAGQIGRVARRVALGQPFYGPQHIAPDRDRCIAALNILEIRAARFEWDASLRAPSVANPLGIDRG